MAWGQILAFSIDFDRRPYNTRTRHTVRVCDCVRLDRVSVVRGFVDIERFDSLVHVVDCEILY